MTPLCQRSTTFLTNPECKPKELHCTKMERKCKGSHLSFQFVTHNLSADVEHPLLHSQRNSWCFEPPGEAGMAMPAFIDNTSAELIAMFEMPAFCNRAFHSSSVSVSNSFSIRTNDSPPLMMLLTVCISAHLVLQFWCKQLCNSNVTFDAALISLGTKEPSAEQQGHTLVHAANTPGADQLTTWQFKRPRQNV
ncbi:hypothetical protein EMCRGX_G001532 [Ephydatia muelleri]